MTQNGTAPPRRWRPRFTLTTMLLVVLVSGMTAAGGRYLVLGLRGDTSSRATFVMSVLLLPVVLLVIANAIRLSVMAWRRSQRQRRK